MIWSWGMNRGALAAALAMTAWAPHASADGGLARAWEIIEEPGNPNDVLLRSDYWGFFRTTDGGATWQWTCAEIYGAGSSNSTHANTAMLPGGRVLVANGFKGLHVTDDFCNWKEIAALRGPDVTDVVVSGGNVFALTSTYKAWDSGTGGGVDGTLWKSTDQGDTFKRVGSPLPGQFGGWSVKFSLSDPNRVYIAGRIVNEPGGILQRSDDAGATWKQFDFTLSDDNMRLRIAAVHPTRPDVVFIWGDLPEGLGTIAPDQIYGTADGGQTWTTVYKGSADLPGFAFSPDGTEVIIAGPEEGIQRAKVDDALSKGQSAFTQEFKGRVWGLHWTAAGFTAGNDNYTARGIPAFTYGKSTDEGKSFTEIMNLCELKHDICSDTSSVGATCSDIYPKAQDGFIQWTCTRPATAPDAGVVSKPVAGKSSGGCACSIGEGMDTRGASAAALGLSVFGLRLLRRKR